MDTVLQDTSSAASPSATTSVEQASSELLQAELLKRDIAALEQRLRMLKNTLAKLELAIKGETK